jgi:hypothetical protein
MEAPFDRVSINSTYQLRATPSTGLDKLDLPAQGNAFGLAQRVGFNRLS